MKKIDWDKVWKDFDKWYELVSGATGCKHCGHKTYEHTELKYQQKAIQFIVEAQLKPKRKP